MENEDISFEKLELNEKIQWIKNYVYNNSDNEKYQLFLKDELQIDFLESIKEGVIDNMKKKIYWILERLNNKTLTKLEDFFLKLDTERDLDYSLNLFPETENFTLKNNIEELAKLFYQ
jgi:hypothetical protein